MKFARELEKGDVVARRSGSFTVAETPLVNGQWVYVMDEHGEQHTIYAYELVGPDGAGPYRTTRMPTEPPLTYELQHLGARALYEEVVALAVWCDEAHNDDDSVRRLYGAAALIRQAEEEMLGFARVQRATS